MTEEEVLADTAAPAKSASSSAAASAAPNASHPVMPAHCLNPASDINARLDTQVEVRVYPCNNNSTQGNKKKFTQFNVKPEVSFVYFGDAI
jgi:hypothetical protein